MQRVSEKFYLFQGLEFTGNLIEPFSELWDDLTIEQKIDILGYLQVKERVLNGEITE